MNGWDKTFWALFALIEVAIVAFIIFFYSIPVVMLGFAVIAVGFAKVGEYVFHKKTAHEMREHRETVRKVTNWMNRQYELTQSIKDIYEHRFHHTERKRSELEESLDKRYRELAGKIIDVENRLNLVSRAVIAQKAVTIVQKPVVKVEHAFDAAWKDIISIASGRDSISTLSRGIRNRIVSVMDDALILRSDLTKKERTLRMEEFRHFWEILRAKGRMNFIKDVHDPRLVRMGSIIISFLARLPNVEYGISPRMLYMMDWDTHAIGTVKKTGKSL